VRVCVFLKLWDSLREVKNGLIILKFDTLIATIRPKTVETPLKFN